MKKAITVNTAKAHQLIHFAKEQGKQDEAEELLFKSYFTDGKNIEDTETLLDLGISIGLDKAALKTALESEKYMSAVKADIEEGQSLGFTRCSIFCFR